jgi:hypothetical protein
MDTSVSHWTLLARLFPLLKCIDQINGGKTSRPLAVMLNRLSACLG